MRIGYVSLEEAHPPFKRVEESQMGSALEAAFKKAAGKGRVAVPVPDALRTRLLAAKKRHRFTEDRK